MIQTKKSQLVFILPFHPSSSTLGDDEPRILKHHLFSNPKTRGKWQLSWGAPLEGQTPPKKQDVTGEGLLSPTTEKTLSETLRIWEFPMKHAFDAEEMRRLHFDRTDLWYCILDGQPKKITPKIIRVVDTTQDIAMVTLQLQLPSSSMEASMKFQRKMTTETRSKDWPDSAPWVPLTEEESMEPGIIYFLRKTSKDGPIVRHKTTANRLLKAIASDVLQKRTTSHIETPRLFNSRNLGFHAVEVDDSAEIPLTQVDLKLSHHGYHLMKKASPTWGQKVNNEYHFDNPDERYSFWLKHDSILLCTTGTKNWVQQLFSEWFGKPNDWFFSYLLNQAFILRANELEDLLKESVANQEFGPNAPLPAMESKFEVFEWEYLQLSWTMNHTLLHLESKRRNFHDELNQMLNVKSIQKSIADQSSLIRSWYTQSWQSSTKSFLLYGTFIGFLTGVLGINISGWTSDSTGLPLQVALVIAGISGTIGLIIWLRSFFAEPLKGPNWLMGRTMNLASRRKSKRKQHKRKSQGPPWG